MATRVRGKRRLFDVANATAFRGRLSDRPTTHSVETRVRLGTLLLLTAMPATLGLIAHAAAFSRSGTTDGAFPLGVVAMTGAASLLLLGLRSRLSIARNQLTVRFFGLRSTTVEFEHVKSATYGMTFPSISLGMTLKDHQGKRAVVHANWWREEPTVIALVAQQLLERDIAMDEATASIVARTLRVPRPAARIMHRPLLRRDRP
jgi:hypothetical protein